MIYFSIFKSLLIAFAVTGCIGDNSTAPKPDEKCEEEAVILSTQLDRYDEFRDLQKFLLAKLEALDTKTQWALTPEANCSENSVAIVSELVTLTDLVQRLGRNVESITNEPTSCADIQTDRQRFGLRESSGVYSIFVAGRLLRVYCDFNTDGGGWTVFQRRINADTDFHRIWTEYKRGFGNPMLNYWLGNDILHLMTRPEVDGEQELRVELTDWDDVAHHVTYRGFSIADETSRYRLSVGPKLSGNMSDALGVMHNGKSFGTKDKFVNYGLCIDCPGHCSGAWWFGCCYYAYLNGLLIRPGKKGNHRLARWYDKNEGKYIHAKRTEMKFRPQVFVN